MNVIFSCWVLLTMLWHQRLGHFSWPRTSQTRRTYTGLISSSGPNHIAHLWDDIIQLPNSLKLQHMTLKHPLSPHYRATTPSKDLTIQPSQAANTHRTLLIPAHIRYLLIACLLFWNSFIRDYLLKSLPNLIPFSGFMLITFGLYTTNVIIGQRRPSPHNSDHFAKPHWQGYTWRWLPAQNITKIWLANQGIRGTYHHLPNSTGYP